MHPFLKHFEATETLDQVNRDLMPDNTGGDSLGGLLSTLENESVAESKAADPEKTAKDAALKKLLGGLIG